MDDLKRIIKLLEEQGKKISKIEKILESQQNKILMSSKIDKFLSGTSGKKKGATDKRKSITDLFIELKESKFFNQPKFVNQIIEKLAEEGHHYSRTSLTAPLQRAVRNRILGRVRKDGIWAYVAR